MYSDSFFRHTNKMLSLLKQAGHIRSGIRSQSTALKGGYWNRVMHFQAPGKNWVLKQFLLGEDNPMFPNLPDHEAHALRDLGESDIAPGYIDFIPDADGGPVLIYEYQEGGDWRDDTASIGRLLKALHGMPVSHDYRSLNVKPSDILNQSDMIVATVKPSHPAWLELDALRPKTVPHPGLDRPCLIHTDCGPGNIIVADKGPVLIDWQCPGLGDPVEDLACFTSPGIQLLYGCPPLNDGQINDLLMAYDEDTVVDRFHSVRRYYHFRLACYFLFRVYSLVDSNADHSQRYAQALNVELELLRTLVS